MSVLFIISLVVIVLLIRANTKLKNENERLTREIDRIYEETKYVPHPKPEPAHPHSAPTVNVPPATAGGNYDMSFMYGVLPSRTETVQSGSVPMQQATPAQPVFRDEQMDIPANAAPVQDTSVPAMQAKQAPVNNVNDNAVNNIPLQTGDNSAAENYEKPIVVGMDEVRNYEKKEHEKREREKKNPANAALILGTMFITLAGVIFVSARWWTLDSSVKALLLFSFSGLFFAISALSEKKLGLEHTGRAFFALGGAFLPVAASVCTLFSLFGSEFSAYGELRWLSFSLIALTAAVPAFIAMKKYGVKALGVISLLCLSGAFMLVLRQIFPANEVFALAVSVYAALLVFTQPKTAAFTERIFDKGYELFTVINMFGAAMVALALAESGIIAFMTLIVAGAAFFGRGFSGRNEYLSVIPFMVMLCAASFRLFRPYDELHLEYFVIISLVTAVLSSLGIFSDNVKMLFNVACMITAVPAVMCNLFAKAPDGLMYSESYEIVYMLCMVLITAEVIVLYLRGSSGMIWLIAPFAAAAAHRFGFLVLDDLGWIASGFVIIGLFFLSVWFSRIRTAYSDCFLTAVLIADALVLTHRGERMEIVSAMVISVIFLFVSAAMITVIAEHYQKLSLLRYGIIPAAMLSVFPLLFMFPEHEILAASVLFAVCCVPSAAIIITDKFKDHHKPLVSGLYFSGTVLTFMFLTGDAYPFAIAGFTAVCGFIYLMKQEKPSPVMKYLSLGLVYIAGGSLFAYTMESIARESTYVFILRDSDEFFMGAGAALVLMYIAFIRMKKLRTHCTALVCAGGLLFTGIVLAQSDNGAAEDIFAAAFMLAAAVITVIGAVKYEKKLSFMLYSTLPVLLASSIPLGSAMEYILYSHGPLPDGVRYGDIAGNIASAVFAVSAAVFCALRISGRLKNFSVQLIRSIMFCVPVMSFIYAFSGKNPWICLSAAALCGFVHLMKSEKVSSLLKYWSAALVYFAGGAFAVFFMDKTGITYYCANDLDIFFMGAGAALVLMYIAFILMKKLRTHHTELTLTAALLLDGIVLAMINSSAVPDIFASALILISAAMTVAGAEKYTEKLGFMRYATLPVLLVSSLPMGSALENLIYGYGKLPDGVNYGDISRIIASVLFCAGALVFGAFCISGRAKRYVVPLIRSITVCAGVVAMIYLIGGRYPEVYLLAAAVCGFIYLWKSECAPVWAYIPSGLLYLGTGYLCADLTVFKFNAELNCDLTLAALSAAFMAVTLIVGKKFRHEKHFTVISLAMTTLTAVLCLLSSMYSIGAVRLIWAAYIAGIVLTVMTYLRTGLAKPKLFNFMLFLPALMIFVVCGSQSLIDDSGALILTNAIFLIFCFGGRAIYREGIAERYSLDVLSLSSAAAIPAMICICESSSALSYKVEWYIWFAAAAYFFSFIGRVREKAVCVLNTAGALLLLGAYFFQPFGTVPDHFMLEFVTAGYILFSLGIALIWRNHHGKGNFYFVTAVIYLVLTEVRCIISGYVSDAVFAGIVLVAMMAFAVGFRKRRWLILAVCGTVTLTLLMTAQFWLNASWWFYLLAAGIVLIVWGIAGEVRRKKKRGGEAPAGAVQQEAVRRDEH